MKFLSYRASKVFPRLLADAVGSLPSSLVGGLFYSTNIYLKNYSLVSSIGIV